MKHMDRDLRFLSGEKTDTNWCCLSQNDKPLLVSKSPI